MSRIKIKGFGTVRWGKLRYMLSGKFFGSVNVVGFRKQPLIKYPPGMWIGIVAGFRALRALKPFSHVKVLHSAVDTDFSYEFYFQPIIFPLYG